MNVQKFRDYLFVNQTNKQTAVKNFFWRIVSIFPNKLIRFLVILFAAKLLTPVNFGIYNYIFSLASMAFFLSDFGINILLVRDFQQQEQKETVVVTSFFAKLLVSVLSAVAGLVIFLVWGPEGSLQTGGLLLLLLFATNLKEVMVNYFLAIQKSEKETVVTWCENLFLVGILFCCILPEAYGRNSCTLLLIECFGSTNRQHNNFETNHKFSLAIL
jgi:O-antigen/teichoic acid export membrane protein